MQTIFEQHSSLRFGINWYLQIKVHKKSENQIQNSNIQQMSNVIENQIQNPNTQQMSNVIEFDELH